MGVVSYTWELHFKRISAVLPKLFPIIICVVCFVMIIIVVFVVRMVILP